MPYLFCFFLLCAYKKLCVCETNLHQAFLQELLTQVGEYKKKKLKLHLEPNVKHCKLRS